MPLELQERQLGRVLLVKCAGRIVAGVEAQSLDAHVSNISSENRHLVLDVAEVAFIDSSGLGTLVRLVARIRRSGGDLKLCGASPAVRNLLKLTNLLQVFELHESEVSAVSAFYSRSRPAEIETDASARRVLCIHPSVDTLVYLREVLRRSGYDAITTSNLPDGLVLLKATTPSLVILAGNLQSARNRAAAEILQEMLPGVPVVLLQEDFSRQEAGQAGSWLLAAIRSHLGEAGVAE